jgi:toxin ParE1/3/4
MARAKISRSAVQDLDEVWLYIAQHNIDAAEKVISQLEAAAKKLAAAPGMGRKRDELQAGLRSYPVGRYVLFYRRISGGIEVLHVYHGARRLEDLFGSGGP